MNIFQEIGILFSTLTPATIICIVVGLVLIFVEIFQPGFGVFGILGAILCIAGVIIHLNTGQGNPLAQIFIMVFIICFLIAAAFLLMLSSAKKGWISRSPLIEKGTAISQGISEGTKDYTNIINMIGTASTDLRPSGRAVIGDEIYDVVTDGFYITKGEGVKVIAVEGVKVTVRRAE